jgi:hypothetical protein
MTPSNHSDSLATINDARASIAALRAALKKPSPDQIMGCLPALSEAAERLSAIETELLRNSRPAQPDRCSGDQADSELLSTSPPDSGEITRALKSLKSDLRAAVNLIEHGAAFYRGWARLLGAASAGYTPSGEAVPLAAPGSVSVAG